jgi:hypothetical protein
MAALFGHKLQSINLLHRSAYLNFTTQLTDMSGIQIFGSVGNTTLSVVLLYRLQSE